MLLSPQNLHQTYSIGLDPSLTSFGVYCRPFDPDAEWFGWSLQSTARDGSDTRRVYELATDIILDLSALNVSVVAIEDYGPINRTSGKIAQRAEMCGILKYHALHRLRVPVITATPTALKAFATGDSKASKEKMLKEAARFSYHPNTHDEADAFFVARLGAFVMEGQKIGASYERVNP